MTSTNEHLISLIKELKTKSLTEKVKLWKRLAEDLSRSTRSRRIVNLIKIVEYAKPGETVVVPGKVLGLGEVTQKVDVAAYQFSISAVEKIKLAGGNTLSLWELMEKNPKANKVRIIG